jgi:hypothetical protein
MNQPKLFVNDELTIACLATVLGPNSTHEKKKKIAVT